MVSPQGTKLSIERSNYAARTPHEALVRARCQAVIPSTVSKSEVTIDCYSEKRSRPSPWSGSAPTGARAWGSPPVAVQETRQKSFFSSRKFGLYQHALAALEHASILSPSIRSPHGSANGYASMETYLLFALYLLRSIGSLGQLWNALALEL